MDTQMVLTHTGKIYFNRSLGLEFLTVGDYGKENNIKADFLGLTKKIEGVQHHDVDLMDKWVATISSQKGCPMKCTFCDVHKYGFFVDGCWCCKNRHNCNQCKEVRKYRKQHFPPKEKSRHGKADHDDRGE